MDSTNTTAETDAMINAAHLIQHLSQAMMVEECGSLLVRQIIQTSTLVERLLQVRTV